MLGRARFSMAGLREAWRRERSFRTQLAFVALGLALLAWRQPEAIWWAIVLLALAVGSAMELINASLEALADRVHPERHPQVGVAKDMASASAFVVNCCSAGLLVAALL